MFRLDYSMRNSEGELAVAGQKNAGGRDTA